MPDPQRLLATLHRATALLRAQPGRKGRMIALPADREVIVCGDLHGHLGNFRSLLQQAQLDAQPQRHLVVQELIHGPFCYPNGGDKSHQLLDLTAALICQFPQRVHFLLGNHELSQWHNQLIGKGEINCNDLFRAGIEDAYGEHADEVYAAYVGLFAAAQVAIRTANRVFLSHTLPSARHLGAFDLGVVERDDFNAADVKLGGAIHSLLWDRDVSPANAAAFLQKVDADWLITGHIPTDAGFTQPNDQQLILDAKGTPGCYCIFPTDRPLTMADLLAGLKNL